MALIVAGGLGPDAGSGIFGAAQTIYMAEHIGVFLGSLSAVVLIAPLLPVTARARWAVGIFLAFCGLEHLTMAIHAITEGAGQHLHDHAVTVPQLAAVWFAVTYFRTDLENLARERKGVEAAAPQPWHAARR